jgi:hypothetical protein
MNDTFGGKLTFEDGESVSIDLSLKGETLEIMTDDKPVGVWPLKFCRVSRTGSGSFLLSIDGEKVVFAPDDQETFALAAAQRFQSSSLADRIGVVRSAGETETKIAKVPEVEEPDTGARLQVPWRRIAPLLAVLVLIVAVATWALGRSDDSELPAALGGSNTVPGPPTTTFESTLPPLFSQTPPEFVAAWNATAQSLGVDVPIRGLLNVGTFETQLTPFIDLLGTTDAQDTIASVVVVIDPSGGTDDDTLALATLGVAITVADPDIGPEGRREILERLGLDPDRPELDRLEGEADYPQARYRIQYFPEFNSILFNLLEP